MTFRNDGEPVKDRAERLDQELDQAQRVLRETREKRLQHLEFEVAESHERLRLMQGTIEQLREGGPRTARAPSYLPIVLPLGLIGVVGLAFGRASTYRHANYHPSEYGSGGHAIAAAMAPTHPEASEHGTLHSVATHWSAKVRKVAGMALPTGASCNVEATLTGDGEGIEPSSVTVTCDGRTLYHQGNYLGSVVQASIDEFPGETDGAFRYGVIFEDKSSSSADKRAEISLDTEAHTAVVQREAAPAFRVELDVEDGVSFTHDQAVPLVNVTRAVDAKSEVWTTRSGRVATASANSGLQAGARCSVELLPALPHSGYSCRAFVKCGDKTIYGGERSGFADCSGDASSLRIHDDGVTLEDGDPKMDLDLRAGTVSLSDNDVNAWNATLKLDPPASR